MLFIFLQEALDYCTQFIRSLNNILIVSAYDYSIIKQIVPLIFMQYKNNNLQMMCAVDILVHINVVTIVLKSM